MLFFPVTSNNQATLHSNARTAAPSTGHGETILVIDDEKDILEFTKDLLEFHEYKVVTANNGKNGIEAFNSFSHEISLVICDKEMPGTDGKKVFESIHAAKPEIPFFLVTGLVEQAEKEAFLAAGMRNVLLKPIEIEDLLTFIAKEIKK